MNSYFATNQPRAGRGFSLLEVVLALGILVMAATVLVRSFALGGDAIRKSEIITTGTMLAETLMDEFDLAPPSPGSSSGDFGANFPDYYWEVEVEETRMSYRYSASNPDDLDDLLTYHVQIVHLPEGGDPYVPVHFSYHPYQLELFSATTRYEHQMLEDDR